MTSTATASTSLLVVPTQRLTKTSGQIEPILSAPVFGRYRRFGYPALQIAHAVAQRLAEITGGHGVDVVFDPVGGALTEVARRRLTWEGRYLVIGFAAGEIPAFPANHVLVKNYTVLGVHWSAYTAHASAVVDAAHHDLEQREVIGRLVLVPGEI
jgi:NADPH:quinone reductase-like Zn-dependent oxidoreductase